MSDKIKNIPKHVAVIPDGNRRWARKRGLKPWIGHQEGVNYFERVLEKAIELKIPYFTFWGGSFDNLTKRSKIELKFLFKVYTNQFKRIITDERIHKNKVRVNVLGRWREVLPKETQIAIEKAIKRTKDYNQHFLTFLLAYNGTDEMLNCIQKIANFAKQKSIKITEKLIKENLWTKDLPPVDLIVRTGCENDPHNSTGFMMWDTAYSQLYFSQTLFPDFGPEEFEKIVKDYAQRQRRFGR
ncbi:MAG: di-trans,poly-cis-decaprenylcistransferase [Candidatus Nealsonbacteria bacterium]|nr:di-trans,poly-cis-decaprenylcistransferase [Candidatus Nealsonbacteria bacterium]